MPFTIRRPKPVQQQKNSEIHYNMLANPHKYKAEKKNKKTVVRVTRATLFYPADPNTFYSNMPKKILESQRSTDSIP